MAFFARVNKALVNVAFAFRRNDIGLKNGEPENNYVCFEHMLKDD